MLRLACLILLGVVGCEGCAGTPSTTATTPEEPEVALEPVEPRPVYTSAVCCVTDHTCTLDEAIPLGTTCTCPGPEGALQGHVC
jgi:hypothetical protein